MNTNNALSSPREKQLLGMPIVLIWGYIAIAIFMTGDGIEQAFLSKYVVDLGFSASQASMLFTVYGLVVAVASWLSGVLAELLGPKRVMVAGFSLWIIFHICFLVFGLSKGNYGMMLTMYGIRGLGYPMFIYAFVVWIAYIAPKQRLASAMGWFWCMYSIGVGFFGTYIPSFTIPYIGFMGTLWMSIGWVLLGGFISLFLIRDDFSRYKKELNTGKEKFQELLKGVTLFFENRQIAKAVVVRVINQLSLFGLVVILPLVFTKEVGFSMSEWLRIWGAVYISTIFGNVIWGIIADRIGWIKQVKWFGCVGCAVTTVMFYYVPMAVGPNFWVALFIAVLFGITMSAFVPMSAVFPTLEPNHKGAAVSMHNLSAGLSNFIGPGIATLVLPYFGAVGVIWTYTVLYLFGAVVAHFLKVTEVNKKEENMTSARQEIFYK
ncbi:MFS transporter [Scopulibacillus cellulosilyticus]|uniref:MFS transporter n=1 Tax=Scopulibacillus cellulosilyticus TaxID=2665665 RepID=A0ABW2Q4J7_9BACL